MKILPSSWFAPLLLLAAISPVVGQTTIKAKTESGKDVILSTDGTWKYATESTPSSASVATKPAGAKTLYKAPGGAFGIWYDDTKWYKETPTSQDEGRAEFKLRRGDAYAILLLEELNIPLATLRDIAVENAKEAAPDAKVVFEETRRVNGKEVLCMSMEGTIKGIPFRYYGYYYGGKQGSIQLLTYTGRDLFAKYEQDLSDFLNGLEIY